MNSDIIIYQSEDGLTKIVTKLENETIWMTQVQLVKLYNSSKANVSEHIKHIYEEGELDAKATVRKIRTVQTEGNREVSREIDHYNLDYAAHEHTAAEIVYYRVDSDKPFLGLTTFSGKKPTQAEAMIAKNY